MNANQEIEQALKEFEGKEGGATQPVSSNTVDVMRAESLQIPEKDDISHMGQAIIKYSGGLIKTENGANSVLLAISLIALSLSFYFFFLY